MKKIKSNTFDNSGMFRLDKLEKQQKYVSDGTIPKELKQAMIDFLDAKEKNPLSADLYSDEVRSWAHNFSGYLISEDKADDIIRTFSM